MNPKQFLFGGGIMLLVLGVLGYALPGGRLLGGVLYFDRVENLAHIVLGVVAIVLAFTASHFFQKLVTLLVGLAGLYFAVSGVLVLTQPAPNWYGITNFELLDDLVHLVIGLWALKAAFGKSYISRSR